MIDWTRRREAHAEGALAPGIILDASLEAGFQDLDHRRGAFTPARSHQ